MRLEHSFAIPVPIDRAWRLLLDLPQLAPCLPGVELTGVDGDTFTGTLRVKLGPVILIYKGRGRFVERNETTRRVVVESQGRDIRTAGTAAATVTAVLTAAGSYTTVAVTTDLTVTGRLAQFGHGAIADLSDKLLAQFVDRLVGMLDSATANTPAAPAACAEVAVPSHALSTAHAGTNNLAATGTVAAPANRGTPANSVGVAPVSWTAEQASIRGVATDHPTSRSRASASAPYRLTLIVGAAQNGQRGDRRIGGPGPMALPTSPPSTTKKLPTAKKLSIVERVPTFEHVPEPDPVDLLNFTAGTTFAGRKTLRSLVVLAAVALVWTLLRRLRRHRRKPN